MPRHPSHFNQSNGFTLLEIILAILIAAMVITVAVPTLTGVFEGSKAQDCFKKFDEMVQDAHARSVEEGRNYVLVWGRDKTVLLRPEDSPNEDGKGMQMWKIKKGEALVLHLPAALTEKGATPEAIWTFWATGVCEPAEIHFQGAEGAWTAVYNPFTVQAEARYE